MDVIIKRYRVRHNGVVYGPGQPGGTILAGLSKEEGARLIAGSGGTIEKYVPLEVKVPSESVKAEESEQVKGQESAPEPAQEGVSIPELNPDELIKPVKNKGRK